MAKLIKRKDGSYSQKGLWDNIRANKGSGKKPTAQMLKQEKKIKADSKAKEGKWIQKAIKKPGALREQLGAKKGEPIPAAKLAAAAKKPGKLGQRARLAQTLKKMNKK